MVHYRLTSNNVEVAQKKSSMDYVHRTLGIIINTVATYIWTKYNLELNKSLKRPLLPACYLLRTSKYVALYE